MLGAHFFYQVSEEEITRAQTLAGMLEIPLPHAIGMAIVVKRAAIRVSGTAGTIPGDPAAWCAAQVGWPQADAKRLLEALLCAGHVLAMAGPSLGHSVAFLGPLQAMEETSKKRAEAGKKGAEARKSKGGYGRAMAGTQPGDNHGMARDGKKETENKTEKEKETDLPPPAVASAASGQEGFPEFVWADGAPPEKPTRPAKKPREKKPETPPAEPKPYAAACDMLTRVYAEVRKADYGFGLDAPRNGKAVRELLWGAGAKAGEERGSPLVPLEELERRWRIGLAWRGFPACNAIWDLKEHWAAYGQPQQESARAPPVLDVRRGGVRAELMDHTKPQEPF